jgi:NitT/TauT family transport system ATP-binding protein/sulfonate transport system ATP-binding protein
MVMSIAEDTRRGEVTIRHLSKSYRLNGAPLQVLRDINLHVRSGESLAIVGASGSGKTTLLRVLAGLEDSDTGEVLVDGKAVRGVGAERAVIFQEPRLLPWLTVLDNVAFGLETSGLSREQARGRARHYVKLVGLQQFEAAYPRQLSGGMAQRVGIARALAVQPEILLLDEPLGALDAMTKIGMQQELARIWRDEDVTTILVTHDLEEAIYLADRILILPREKGGEPRLIEIDLPRPRDRSAPEFVRHREELLNLFGLH